MLELAPLRARVDGDFPVAVVKGLPGGDAGGIDLARLDARSGGLFRRGGGAGVHGSGHHHDAPVKIIPGVGGSGLLRRERQLRRDGGLRRDGSLGGRGGDLRRDGAEIADFPSDGHIVQGDGPGDAGGDEQVPGDGHVGQGRAPGGVNQEAALHIAGKIPAGLNQDLDHVVQQVHQFRPGQGLRRAEAVVQRVGNPAPGGELRDVGPGVVGHLGLIVVCERAVRSAQLEGPGHHGHGLLAGDAVPRQGFAPAAQVHPGGVEL